jgi:hypothetical protein
LTSERDLRSKEDVLRFLALSLIAIAVGWPSISYAEA